MVPVVVPCRRCLELRDGELRAPRTNSSGPSMAPHRRPMGKRRPPRLPQFFARRRPPAHQSPPLQASITAVIQASPHSPPSDLGAKLNANNTRQHVHLAMGPWSGRRCLLRTSLHQSPAARLTLSGARGARRDTQERRWWLQTGAQFLQGRL